MIHQLLRMDVPRPEPQPGPTENPKPVALCMGLMDHYDRGIARGAIRYAREHASWQLHGCGWMFRHLDAIESWRGAGIIARVESLQDVERLSALSVPVVDVAGAYSWEAAHQVSNDDYLTGVRAGEYLLSCGLRRFAYCGVSSVGWSEKRKAGLMDAVRTASEDLALFEQSLPWWERLESSSDLEAWMGAFRPPVGLFACNDTAGLRASESCRRIGLRVPEDVAILGVDNEDIVCELAFPTLSSMELDCELIGYRAAALLGDLMAGRAEALEGRGEPLLVPPGRIVERESTRVYASDDPLVAQAVLRIRERATAGGTIPEIILGMPISRRSLELRFGRELGRSIHDELTRVRLDHARRLLADTELRVADVALESGFGTYQRFHAVFRATEGLSPAAYRRSIRGERRRR